MKNLAYLLVIVCLFSSSCQGIKYKDEKKGQGFTLTDVPQFESIDDISINVSGDYLNAFAFRDIQTKVLYLQLSHGIESCSFPLLNAEGKPEIYDGPMAIHLVVSEKVFTLKLGNNYFHGKVVIYLETKVQYLLLNKERGYSAFPLLDSQGVPKLYEGEL